MKSVAEIIETNEARYDLEQLVREREPSLRQLRSERNPDPFLTAFTATVISDWRLHENLAALRVRRLIESLERAK